MTAETHTGRVTEVSFRPLGEWFTSVKVQMDPASILSDVWHQIDGAAYSVSGHTVSRADLIAWLGQSRKAHYVQVTLTGYFGAYPTYESAAFTEVPE